MKLGGCTNLFTLLLDFLIKNREVCTVAASQVECVIGAIMRAKTHVVLPSKILCYTLIN